MAGRVDYFGAGAAFGVWWVDDSGVNAEERAEGVIRTMSGDPIAAAGRNVGEMRIGDRTVHIDKGSVVAVGVIVGDGRRVDAGGEGWLAEVALSDLAAPIEVSALPYEFKIEAGPPGPFSRQGFLQPGTCFPVVLSAASRLARRLGPLDADWTWE